MTTIVTVESLKQNYQNYLQAQNSNINPFGVNSFWDIDAGAMALFFLDLYMNLSLVESTIYPQNSVGTAVDQWLYSKGLPARGELTYGIIEVTVTATALSTLPAGTVFSDTPALNMATFTNNQYTAPVATTSVVIGTTFFLYAINPGSNYIEPVGNYLSATVGGDVITVQVNSSTNGQEQESDQSCINRVLQVTRQPRAGARESDYSVYCLQGSPNVTDSIILPSFIIVNDINILGAFPLIGTFITEYQLNQGLLPATTFVAYSRQADSGTIDVVNDYIQGLKLVTLSVFVSTSLTKNVFTDSIPLTITVALVAGYSLSTLINITSQDINGNPITIQLSVEDLVKREVRRSICNQPYGGTQIGPNLYVTMDSILYSLNSQLSASNGAVAQILTNAVIGNSDQPGGTQTSSYLSYIFDIQSYSSVTVSQQVSL